MALQTAQGPGLVSFAGDGSLGTLEARTSGGQSQNPLDKPTIEVLFYNGSGATIAAGDSLYFDVASSGFVIGKWVKTAPASADGPIVGVALEAATTGTFFRAAVKGYVEGAKTTGASAGDKLQQSGTAGTLETAGATTQYAFAIAITATSSGTSTIWIL